MNSDINVHLVDSYSSSIDRQVDDQDKSYGKNRLHDFSDSPLNNGNDHSHLVEEPEMV